LFQKDKRLQRRDDTHATDRELVAVALHIQNRRRTEVVLLTDKTSLEKVVLRYRGVDHRQREAVDNQNSVSLLALVLA
jgi:hypothetical protein